MPHLNRVYDSVIDFEYKITQFFVSKGYSFTTYLDEINDIYDPYAQETRYDIDPYRLLSKYKCPILKRKAISVLCYENSIKALKFLKNHTTYDVRLIEDDVHKLDIEGCLRPYSFREIDNFCSRYDEVYIYGNGKIGNRIANYLKFKELNFTGFIVSHKDEKDQNLNVREYKKEDIHENVGIIVGVFYPSIDEISEILKRDIGDEQVIYPRL